MSDKSKPAFPSPYDNGMTLREYYAGRGPWTIADVKSQLPNSEEYPVMELNKICARWNHMYADALIDELQREAGDAHDPGEEAYSDVLQDRIQAAIEYINTMWKTKYTGSASYREDLMNLTSILDGRAEETE